KSTDSGKTWALVKGTGAFVNPFSNGQGISKIAVDPANANRIFVASSDRVTNITVQGNPGIWRFDPLGVSGTWTNLTNIVSAVRNAGPKTPGPDDNLGLAFPQINATWSDLALS